jgi:DNA topoisomerase-2
MYLNTKNGLKHYNTPEEIIADFYEERYRIYELRKKHILKELKYKLLILKNKYRFINDIIDENINVNKKRTHEIIEIFDKNNYVKLKSNYYDDEDTASFEYLLSIRIDNFTQEKLNDLEKNIEDIQNKIKNIKESKIEDIWIAELDNFEAAYENEHRNWLNRMNIKDGGSKVKKLNIKLKGSGLNVKQSK